MKLIVNQKFKNILLCILFAGLTACSNTSEVERISAGEYREIKNKLADFEKMKPGLHRLLAVESDLKELMTVLNEPQNSNQQYVESGDNVEVETIEKHNFKEKVVTVASSPVFDSKSVSDPLTTEISDDNKHIADQANVDNVIPVSPSREAVKKYFVQLASVTESDSINLTWEQMKRKNPDLLDDLEYSSEQVTVSSRTYYRIKAGPMTTMQAAKRLCDNLKIRGSNCFTVRG